jgi:LmbE family N-acetylglucosaminyl deacetylase
VTERLVGRVVVLSPHLDDAVFSLGATISKVAGAGSCVEVLTVFSDDPLSDAPAIGWDTRGGFTTEGEAARARREEDREACRLLGAHPHWLPFCGGGYTPDKDKDAITAAIGERVAGADTLLVPGFPLQNPDHRWLTELLESKPPRVLRIGRYVEQPYSYAVRKELPLPRLGWETVSLSLGDRLRKRRAILAYASQLPMLSVSKGRLNRLVLQSEPISWRPE